MVITLTLLTASNTFAASGLGCGDGFGPLAKVLCGVGKDDKAAVGTQLNKTISTIIGVMTAVAAIWFIIRFIIGGFMWIQAGGDKNNLQQARDHIVNSLIGLIIVVGAWIIIGIIGKIVGLDILNPGKLMQTLGS